eukprot:gene2334-2802_t
MSEDKVYELIKSKKHLDEIFLMKGKMIIDFYSVWCPDCDDIEDTFTKLSKKFNNIRFYKLTIDIPEFEDVYNKIPITSIPSFCFYENGEEKFFLEGFDDLENLVETFEKDGKLPKSQKFEFTTNEKLFKDNDYEYDIMVIGGGSGGFQCAKKSSSFGAKVGLFNFVQPTESSDIWGLGGTCVNVGCIPKKLFHQAGLLGEFFKDSKNFGWTYDNKKHDWSKLQQNVKTYTSKLNWKHEGYARKSKVNYIHAYASFIDQNTVEAVFSNGEKKKFTSKYFVIATGGRPTKFDIPGVAWQNTCKKEIVGGSYIAVETAGFLASLGCETTISVRSSMLKHFDDECVDHVISSLKKQKIRILEQCHISKISKNEKGLQVDMKMNEKIIIDTFDTVIAAIGRTPSLSGLNISNVGVKVENDHIIVSDSLQTNIENIFSLGDAVGMMDLTPVAIAQGRFIAQSIFTKKAKKIDYNCVPTTIFSPMEYGICGLSEKKAIERYTEDDIIVYKKNVNVLEFQLGFQFSHREQAFFKLICLKSENEKVIGFHYVGPNAGEITGPFSMAIKKKITKDELDDCIGIHPTMAEVINQLEFGVTQDTGCCGN